MSTNLPPGSEGLPLLGETLSFARDPFLFFAERAERHGPVFRTNLLGRKTICLSGPEAFECSTRDELFQRQGASPASWQELLSPGAVPFLDGDAHRIRKRLLLQAVGPKALPNFLPTLVQLVDAALERAAGREVSFVDEAADLAFRVTETLFAAGDPQRPTAELRQAFDEFTQGIFAPAVPLPFSKYSGARRASALLRRRFLERIALRRAQPAGDVLSGLLQAEVEGVRLSDDEAAAETLHFFFAAYAGLATLLADLMLALTQHDDVRAAAEAEVAQVLAGRAPAMDDFAALAHCGRIAREVRRLYPVIPFTFFATARQDVAIVGHTIPAGWQVMGLTWQTSRDPKAFRDPTRFDPDRFAPGRDEGSSSPSAYVPQGGGPPDGHRCAGEALTQMLLTVLAARACGHWRWTAPPQDFSLNMRLPPPRPRDGLRLTLTRR